VSVSQAEVKRSIFMKNNEPPENASAGDNTQLPANNAAKKPEATDPFDPAKLKLDQNFGATLGVKKLLKTIRVGKPLKEWWVRTHPDPAYCLETAVVELKSELQGETYLV